MNHHQHDCCCTRSSPRCFPFDSDTRAECGDAPTSESAAALRTRLAEITAAISHQTAALARLEGARRALEAGLRRVVYPVLSLPPEILEHIFGYVRPSRLPRLFHRQGGPGLNAVGTVRFRALIYQVSLLCRVCKAWNAFAAPLSAQRSKLWEDIGA